MKKLFLLSAVGCWLSAAAADSLNCRLVGQCTPGYALGVAVSGNYAYVAVGMGLRVILVSDPAHPTEVGSCACLASGVAVSGNYAYIADHDTCLRIISVSDPAHPSEIGHCNTPDYAYGVAVDGDYAYVADGAAGLQIYQYYGGGIEEGRRPSANGTRPAASIVRGVLFLQERASPSASCLLDISGRKVLDLKPGANDVSRLRPGVYFVREAQAQAQAVRKVIVTQ